MEDEVGARKAEQERIASKDVYVLIGVWGGVLDVVKVFTSQELANKAEEQLCKNYGVPYEEKERTKFYEENEYDGDICTESVTLDETILPANAMPSTDVKGKNVVS